MPKHQNIRSNNLISHLSNFQKSERGRDLIFYLSKQKIKKRGLLSLYPATIMSFYFDVRRM